MHVCRLIAKKAAMRFAKLPSYFVRMEGLEPPRREAPDPKSGAATNYATCAYYLGMKSLITF